MAFDIIQKSMDISINQSLSKYIPSFLSNFLYYFLYFFFQFRNWITVAGIRSTGLSACLGIAKHVGQLLKNEIGHKRDNDSALLRCSPGRGLAWHTGGATVVMDGEQYMMTHPITRFGHQFSSKLWHLLPNIFKLKEGFQKMWWWMC